MFSDNFWKALSRLQAQREAMGKRGMLDMPFSRAERTISCFFYGSRKRFL